MTSTITFTIDDAKVAQFLSDIALAHNLTGLTNAEAWAAIKGKLREELIGWAKQGKAMREAPAKVAADAVTNATTITVE